MLFEFFKKHEKQQAVNEHLDGFQSQFNEQQKKAIMCSLFIIAHSDGEYHNKEHNYLDQIATVLGYNLGSDYDSIVHDFISVDREKVLIDLNTLTESQKDWYIITAFGMVHVDGKALEEEFQYLILFLNNMEITEKRFEDVIDKNEKLMNMFS